MERISMHRSEQEKYNTNARGEERKVEQRNEKKWNFGVYKEIRETGMEREKLKFQFRLFLTIVSIFRCALVVDSTPFKRARPTELKWRDKGASRRSNTTVGTRKLMKCTPLVCY